MSRNPSLKRSAMLRNASLVMLTILIVMLPASPVLGYKIMAEPSGPIDIKDVLVGSKTAYEVKFTTDSESEVILQPSIAGDIKDWVSVEPQSTKISKAMSGSIKIILNTENISLGTYFGYLVVLAQSSFSDSHAIPVNIHLTQDEIVSADMENVVVFDMFSRDDIVLEAVVKNTGNKPIPLNISVEISSSGNTAVIAGFEELIAGIMPGEERTVTFNRKVNLPQGDYYANVFLRSGIMTFAKATTRFRVAEASQATGMGMFQDYKATIIPSGRQYGINISGTFRNNGLKVTEAWLISRIYCDDAQVKELVSNAQIVDIQGSGEFSTEFIPEKSCVYSIRSYFEYGGGQTVEKTLNTKINVSDNVELGVTSISIFLLVIFAITLRLWLKKSKELSGNEGQNP